MSDTKQLIADLRGGIPDHCDFCNTPTRADLLEPEEAGAWACHECLERWRKIDNAIPQHGFGCDEGE